mmetsp:Transcript_21560/g.51143  ORF Transcript_21560/g.51143 Transcript_21560/m.51143 type:complete len:238 (-) Transcript_21560:1718-2431(-)
MPAPLRRRKAEAEGVWEPVRPAIVMFVPAKSSRAGRSKTVTRFRPLKAREVSVMRLVTQKPESMDAVADTTCTGPPVGAEKSRSGPPNAVRFTGTFDSTASGLRSVKVTFETREHGSTCPATMVIVTLPVDAWNSPTFPKMMPPSLSTATTSELKGEEYPRKQHAETVVGASSSQLGWIDSVIEVSTPRSTDPNAIVATAHVGIDPMRALEDITSKAMSEEAARGSAHCGRIIRSAD